MNGRTAKQLRRIAKMAIHETNHPWHRFELKESPNSIRLIDMCGRKYYQAIKKEYLRTIRS